MARGVGSGNFAGFHYSKKNCEELIREFFKRKGYEIDKYMMDFKTAKAIAIDIRNENWYKTFLGKELQLQEETVDSLVKAGLITLRNDIDETASEINSNKDFFPDVDDIQEEF